MRDQKSNAGKFFGIFRKLAKLIKKVLANIRNKESHTKEENLDYQDSPFCGDEDGLKSDNKKDMKAFKLKKQQKMEKNISVKYINSGKDDNSRVKFSPEIKRNDVDDTKVTNELEGDDKDDIDAFFNGHKKNFQKKFKKENNPGGPIYTGL
jgi:hypothetical protein